MEEAENAQTIEQEKRAAELSERVNAATLEQLEARISADFALLKKIAPSAEKDAKEAHLDMRYLRERQLMLIVIPTNFGFYGFSSCYIGIFQYGFKSRQNLASAHYFLLLNCKLKTSPSGRQERAAARADMDEREFQSSCPARGSDGQGAHRVREVQG